MNELRLTLITGEAGNERAADIGLRFISGEEFADQFTKDLADAIVEKGVGIEMLPGELILSTPDGRGARFRMTDEEIVRVKNFLSFCGEKKVYSERGLNWKFVVSVGNIKGTDSFNVRGELLQQGTAPQSLLAQA